MALGGKRAERVSDEAVDQLLHFLAIDGTIDERLADQLILPLARLRTSQVTRHLLTNSEVLRTCVPSDVHVTGEVGSPGLIEVQGPELYRL